MKPFPERLLAQIRHALTGCWEFTGRLDRAGYGRIGYRGKSSFLAHRAAYLEWVGDIPPSQHIDHICWNRCCCNPAHLRILSPRESYSRQRKTLSPNCKRGHPLKQRKLQRVCLVCERAFAAKRRQRKTFLFLQEGAR